MTENLKNINYSKVLVPIQTRLASFNNLAQDLSEKISLATAPLRKNLQEIQDRINSLPPETRKNIHRWGEFYYKHRHKHPKLEDMGVIELVEWVERIIHKGLLDDYIVSFNAKKYIEQRNMVVELTDRHVLEAVICTWLKVGADENLFIKMRLNEILAFKGTEPRTNADGVKSGYLKYQKEDIEKSLDSLVKMGLLVVVSHPRHIQVRPSDLILAFIKEDYKTKLLAKRIYQLKSSEQQEAAYYLHNLWRNRQDDESYTEPFKIEKILKQSYLKDTTKDIRPQRIADRFENMLEDFVDHHIIKSYEIIPIGKSSHKIVNEDGGFLPRKPNGWFKDWLQWKISIEPPEDLFDYYREHIDKKPRKKKRKRKLAGDPIKQLRKQREKKGLTQDEVGKLFGISRGYVSMLESGKRVPPQSLEEKIKSFVTL